MRWPAVVATAALAVSLAGADNSECSGSSGIYSGTLATTGDSEYAGNSAAVLWKLVGSDMFMTMHNEDFSRICQVEFHAACIPRSPTSELREMAMAPAAGGAGGGGESAVGLPPQPSPPGPCPADLGDPTDAKMMLLSVRKTSSDCHYFECDQHLWSESPPMQFSYCFYRSNNAKDNRLVLTSHNIELSCGVEGKPKVPVTISLTRGYPRNEITPPAWFYWSVTGTLAGIVVAGWVALFASVPICSTPEEKESEGGDPQADGQDNGLMSDAVSTGSRGSDTRHPDRKLRCRSCMVAISDPYLSHCWSCGAYLQDGGLVVMDKRKQAVRIKRSRPPPQPQQQQQQQQQRHAAYAGDQRGRGSFRSGRSKGQGRPRPDASAPFGRQSARGSSSRSGAAPHAGSGAGAASSRGPHPHQERSYRPDARTPRAAHEQKGQE